MRGFGEPVMFFFSLKKQNKNKSKNFIPMHYHSCSIPFFKFIESLYSQHTRILDMVHL